jgi:tetratricopeptide (TPR) repeat protein
MTLLFLALFILLPSTAHTATTTQSTTGNCSPAVSNVTGNVSIYCEGIDPKALNRLNELLDLKDKDLGETRKTIDEKIQDANEWARKYRELEARFLSANETNELSIQANQSLQNGDFVTAGARLDELLTRQEGDVEKIAANHYSRAQLYDLDYNPQLALPHYEKAYRYRPEVFEYAFEYARSLQFHYEFIRAAAVYNEQLIVLRRNSISDQKSQAHLAAVLNNLGLIYVATQRLKDAEQCYDEALRIRRELANSSRSVYSLDLLQTLINLSGLYNITGRAKDALTLSDEGIVVFQQSVASTPGIYPPGFAPLFDNMVSLIKTGSANYSEAEKLIKQYVSTMRSLAETNPPAYLRYLAQSLNMLASFRESYLQWDEAVSIYEESVSLLYGLAVVNPAAYRLQLADTLGHLGLAYALTWNRMKSKNAYQEAVNIYRDLFTVYPALHKPFLADTLRSLAMSQVGMDQTNGEKNFQESIDLYRELVVADPIRYRPVLADTLLEFVVFVNLTKASPTAKEIQYSEEAVGIYRNLWLEHSETYTTGLSHALSVFGLVLSRSKHGTPTACQLARGIEKESERDKDIHNRIDKLTERACS